MILSILAAALAASPAHATLGGDGESVVDDQFALHAIASIDTRPEYTDYKLATPDGVIVHEFVDPAGRVFEVTWSATGRRPNMRQILGRYIERFNGEKDGGLPAGRHASVADADLEIHSRAADQEFSGSAHIPALTPEAARQALRVAEEAQ